RTTSPPFPYTTLFRSRPARHRGGRGVHVRPGEGPGHRVADRVRVHHGGRARGGRGQLHGAVHVRAPARAGARGLLVAARAEAPADRESTRLNSSHVKI